MKGSASPVQKCAPVTVIIPAYNVESCLQRAVFSALNQLPPPLEVIVINDGSTDATAEVARQFDERIVYIEQSNQGQGAARNTGLEQAKGEFIAFLDADDYWLPGFIKATTNFMVSHSEVIAVSTGWKIDQHNNRVVTFPSPELSYDIPRSPTILNDFFYFWGRFDHLRTGTVLIRHSTINKAGPQNSELRISQDLEYWGYIATEGKWGFIPEIYWVGDSAKIAARGGWLKKYNTRRKLCSSVESWQERILPRLKKSDWAGFKIVRGRVSSNYAHSMILAWRFQDAREIVRHYGSEMPKNRVTRIMMLGHRCGFLGWLIACCLFILREYQKVFFWFYQNNSLHQETMKNTDANNVRS